MTNREAAKVAKDITAVWIKHKVNDGSLTAMVEHRYGDYSLGDQMELLRRLESALGELAERLRRKKDE